MIDWHVTIYRFSSEKSHYFWGFDETEMSQMNAIMIFDKWSDSYKGIAQITTLIYLFYQQTNYINLVWNN